MLSTDKFVGRYQFEYTPTFKDQFFKYSAGGREFSVVMPRGSKNSRYSVMSA